MYIYLLGSYDASVGRRQKITMFVHSEAIGILILVNVLGCRGGPKLSPFMGKPEVHLEIGMAIGVSRLWLPHGSPLSDDPGSGYHR